MLITKTASNFFKSKKKKKSMLGKTLGNSHIHILVQLFGTAIGNCDEKTAILSCCLSILQYDNPTHTQSLDI